MAQLFTTPIRKFHLVQIGVGKAPRLDASTELTYVPRIANDELFGGGTVDYYAARHNPLQWGRVKYTGQYTNCGVPGSNAYSREELDYIQQAKTNWTPFLFYVDHGELPNPPYEPYLKGTCGIYLWTFGKVTDLTSIMTAEDYLAPSVSGAVSIQADLRTPLVRATYSRWRYGYPPSILSRASYLPPVRLDSDSENLNAETADTWYCPCDLVDMCDAERFWPRNLYNDQQLSGSVDFDPTHWECRYIQMEAGAETNFEVYGNAHPRTRIVVRGDALITIRNEFGTFNYSFPSEADASVYTDSWTGVVMEQQPSGDIGPLAAGVPPQLSWGKNIITTTAPVIVGATEAWIN